jgi:hypothetical protein
MARIAFISISNPASVNSFSGTSFHALSALRTQHAVDIFYVRSYPKAVSLYYRLMSRLFGSSYRTKNSLIYAYFLSKNIKKQIAEAASGYDYLLFFNCIQLLSYFPKTGNAKILYYSDAVFSAKSTLGSIVRTG